MLPGSVEQRELSEIDEPLGVSPTLEMRRTTTSVPLSLQSPIPSDRSTGKLLLFILI